MRKLLKFQLKDLIISYSVFAGIIFLLTICSGTISFIYEDVNISLNGTGITCAIFCLAVGIGMYKEHCQMAVLNSISRKDFFKSTACVTVIISFLCTLLDLVILFISQMTGLISADSTPLNTFSIIQTFYPGAMKSHPAALTAANFLLALLINELLFSVGILIAGIYCRLPKKFRTLYCIALPVIGLGVSPVFLVSTAVTSVYPGFISRLIDIFLAVMGISSNNPFLGILTLTAISLVMAGICYQVLRKTEIV